MTRRPTPKRRVQKAVATMTHTADTADIIETFRQTVGTINAAATEGHARLNAHINDHAMRLNETRRIEVLRKSIARQANALLLDGYQRVGITPLGKRLSEGYAYEYLPIVGTDGMADTTQADVWRKAVKS